MVRKNTPLFANFYGSKRPKDIGVIATITASNASVRFVSGAVGLAQHGGTVVSWAPGMARVERVLLNFSEF